MLGYYDTETTVTSIVPFTAYVQVVPYPHTGNGHQVESPERIAFTRSARTLCRPVQDVSRTPLYHRQISFDELIEDILRNLQSRP